MSRCSATTLSGNQCKNISSKECCWVHTKNECGICLNESNRFKQLECGHKFCECCINTWILEKNYKSSCPMCRVQISKDEVRSANSWGIKNDLLYKVQVYYYPIDKMDLMDIFILKTFFNINRTFSINDEQFQKIMNGFRITKLENVCCKAFENLLDKRYSFHHFIKKNGDDHKYLHVFLL